MQKKTRKQSEPAGTSDKAMLFARWRHHIHFASSFAYASFNAKVTKISKWSRIQDSCQITPKIESLVAYAMPDIASKFQKDLSITFWVILLTHRQTNRQTKTGKNITSLAKVKTKMVNQMHTDQLLVSVNRYQQQTAPRKLASESSLLHSIKSRFNCINPWLTNRPALM